MADLPSPLVADFLVLPLDRLPGDLGGDTMQSQWRSLGAGMEVLLE